MHIRSLYLSGETTSPHFHWESNGIVLLGGGGLWQQLCLESVDKLVPGGSLCKNKYLLIAV